MPLDLDEATHLFTANHPKAVDIPIAQYREDAANFNRLAQTHGYRFAGERLGRAVFTTSKVHDRRVT